MASNVSEEFRTFCNHMKHLRQILRDTQTCFKDINTAGSWNGHQVVSAELSESEEHDLDSLTRKPPGIIILGQTDTCKAVVANEIFGKCVLPTPPFATNEDSHAKSMTKPWRTVRLKYGRRQRISYCLANSFELVGDVEATEKQPWTTIPQEALQSDNALCIPGFVHCQKDQSEDQPSSASDQLRHTQDSDSEDMTEDYMSESDEEDENMSVCDRESPHESSPQKRKLSADDKKSIMQDLEQHSLVVEVTINHAILTEGAQVIIGQVTDSNNVDANLEALMDMCTNDLVTVFIYALSAECFSQEELLYLGKLRQLLPDIAIFFVRVPPKIIAQHDLPPVSPLTKVRSTVQRHSFLPEHHSNVKVPAPTSNGSNALFRRRVMSTAQSSLRLFEQLVELGYLSILPGASPSKTNRVVQSDSDSDDFYAVESELVENFDSFIMQLNEFIHKVLHGHLLKVVSLMNVIHIRCLQTFIMTAFDMARDMLITPKRITFARDRENELYSSLMDMALRKQDEIKKIISETIESMKDELIERAVDYDFIGVTLSSTGEVTSTRDLKTCTSQIQDLVLGNLNSAVASKLLGSVDILKDSYTGVLTRCLESLESSDMHSKEATRTSLALREILTSAYQVEITIRAGSSVVKVLMEKMKQLIHTMPWRPAPVINAEWKKRVASDMLKSLSETRLARSICSQIKDRLKQSHETFSSALKQLESRHSGRLERTEEQRLRVRKVHAPRVARLALESTSFKDMVAFGMPKISAEIGRGQYGVVHGCTDAWGGFNPCAIKSVVPPDDKHWNDLAMEFFYTKNVPEHDRVVVLRGSVIDYKYGGGTPAVWLVMDRLEKDLYTAIKKGLDWLSRLQVAIDVVEGIRYLHSQGLVHRDIKLKNVLLDKHNRAKLTDLGFCKPEAMMSGSIVGTPIHMAPELFSGRYDNTVDVYAFGILFWYVCAGHIRLPHSFELCTNKEMLWTSVRRGVRPERLSQFDEECWLLMQSCWEGEPNNRPLLGCVQPKLDEILERYQKLKPSSKVRGKGSSKHHSRNTKS